MEQVDIDYSLLTKERVLAWIEEHKDENGVFFVPSRPARCPIARAGQAILKNPDFTTGYSLWGVGHPTPEWAKAFINVYDTSDGGELERAIRAARGK